jgi:Kef-type K+ transport system membrane component KefB
VTVASVGLGAAVAVLLDEPGLWRVPALPDGQVVPAAGHALLVSAAIAATALPVVARILQEKRILGSPVGAIGVGVSAVLTPATFLLLSAGASAVHGRAVLASTVRIGLLLALIAILFGAVRPLLARMLREYRSGPRTDAGVLAVLLTGTLLTGLAADLLGVQALTGGLLFGAAVPQVPGLVEAVVGRLQQVVVVLGIPVFLAVSGLQTDLRLAGPEHLAALALFLVAIVIGKFGVTTLAGRATGLRAGDAAAVGVLVACGGLVTLAVAIAGRQLGLVTPSLHVVLALTAIASTVVTGPLLDRFRESATSPPIPETDP